MTDEQGPPPPPPQLPPAGWYPDPYNPDSTQRYWDGERWTDSYAPVGTPLVDPADPPRELGTVEWVAVAGLTLIAVLAAFSIVADVRYIGILNDRIDGETVDASELADAQDLVDAATLVLSLAIFPIGPAVFLPWFYRAYTNLPRFGLRNLRYGQGWAIGSWFVPILNLFRPKQIANDLERATAGGTLHSVGRLASEPVSPLLHWWWAFFLASAFIGVGGYQYLSEDDPFSDTLLFESLSDERAFYTWQLLAAAVTIVAVVFAVALVRKITRDQHAVIAKPAATRPHLRHPACRPRGVRAAGTRPGQRPRSLRSLRDASPDVSRPPYDWARAHGTAAADPEAGRRPVSGDGEAGGLRGDCRAGGRRVEGLDGSGRAGGLGAGGVLDASAYLGRPGADRLGLPVLCGRPARHRRDA